MTALQIKTEIHKAIEETPDNLLPGILDYLKQIQSLSPEQIKFNNNLNKILDEDKGLFERLAQ